ncbi:MAG: hypothetical protein HFG33_04125 [Bacilli bacterium]|nr:hypothetical protein [Bacilli bacterium]
MKNIYYIFKRLVFAFAVLYSFNIIMESMKLFIPINVYTISSIAVLGFPGLFALVGLLLL